MVNLSALVRDRQSANPFSRSLNEKMKTPEEKSPDGCSDFVRRSSYYQEYLAEREEILRHKWIESEKAGHDIGFEYALIDWVRNHRDKWRSMRRAATSANCAPPSLGN
jgi:hypothetical protein